MIIFAVTRSGFDVLEPVIRTCQYPVWVGPGVLSDVEMEDFRHLGVNLTNLFDPVDPSDKDSIEEALATIADHHLGEPIWVEMII